jgi:hypothetical protein
MPVTKVRFALNAVEVLGYNFSNAGVYPAKRNFLAQTGLCMTNMIKVLFGSLFLSFCVLLIACGGGGSTPPPPPPPPPTTVFPNDEHLGQAIPIKMGTTGGNSTDFTTNTTNQTITCCSGTLGSLVNKGGTLFILSNNHVLDKSDQGAVGDPIGQPGLVDNNCKGGTLVANMSQAAPLKTSNVDAAIAQAVAGAVDPSGAILDLGPVGANSIAAAPPSSTLAVPTINMGVAKSGRSTGLTCSTIGSISTNVQVTYATQCGNGGTTFSVTFVNQVIINGGSFSASGDSGSLVVTTNSAQPVGLLFAGNSTSTTANPIQDVIAALGPFSIVGGGDHAVSCATTASAPGANPGPGISSASATVSPAEMQRVTVVRDKFSDQLMQDSAIKGVGIGASADNPKEGALIVYVSGTPGSPIPAQINGVRTKIVHGMPNTAQATQPQSVSLAAADVARTTVVKNAHADALMAQTGIMGVGVGASSDSPGDPAVVIYVEQGSNHPPIPAVIDGIRTKVIEGDRFRTFNWGKETKPPVSCSIKSSALSSQHSAREHLWLK